jgi:hypothetical protein
MWLDNWLFMITLALSLLIPLLRGLLKLPV